MKKWLIPAFCLWHMFAVFWWTLPHSYCFMADESAGHDNLEVRLFKGLLPDDNSRGYTWLETYIDVTGSQQYWDFFAPFSPKLHQYLSACKSVVTDPGQGTIDCKGKPLFSNLDEDFAAFQGFGHDDRSRLYRLTENLVKLNDPLLLESFTRYYLHRRHGEVNDTEIAQALLVLHQFELHPELRDLPREGYRLDKLLWVTR